jgi:coenzyme Q-binding protein COQ10
MTAYTQREHLKYTASQLFDLVADVERYPEFLSWVIESRIRHRKDHTILVDMTIAAGPLRKRFSTARVLHRPHQIDISSHDPLFDRFEQRWNFEPATNGGTNVEYHVDFKFRSRLLQMLMGKSFADRATATMSAFEHRAHRLYGVSW